MTGSFEGRHFQATVADGRLRIADPAGRIVLNGFDLHYRACSIHNPVRRIRGDGFTLCVDSVDGLAVGDEVFIRKDIYGGVVSRRRPFAVRIDAIDPARKEIRLSQPVPAHWLRSQLGVYLLKLGEPVRPSIVPVETSARDDGSFTAVFTAAADDMDLEVAWRMARDSTRLDVDVTATFKRNLRVHELVLAVEPLLPLRDIYLKNRRIEHVQPGAESAADRYWLWKEGARFADSTFDLLSLHNPGVASVMLSGARRHARVLPRPEVKVRDSSAFKRTPGHDVLAAFTDSGKYASSIPGRDPIHWFEVELPAPLDLEALEFEWFDAGSAPGHLVIEGASGPGELRRLAEGRPVVEGTRQSVVHLDGASRLSRLRVSASEIGPLKRLAIRNVWFLARGRPARLEFNLEHYEAQRFRRHVDGEPWLDTHCTFEERSAPEYGASDEARYGFALHAGRNMPAVPRFMMAPSGYEAVHIWTEHADRTVDATHRAVYLGSDDIRDAATASGGFVRYGHPVTKSVFYDDQLRSTTGRNVEIETLRKLPVSCLKGSSDFNELLDGVHHRGSEICLHDAEPKMLGGPQGINTYVAMYRFYFWCRAQFWFRKLPDRGRAVATSVLGFLWRALGKGPVSHSEHEGLALEELVRRFGSRTWIDHNMHEIRTTISADGLRDGRNDMRDTWRRYGIRYFWHWASEDCMLKNGFNLDLLHSGLGYATPTPVYWRHPTVMGDFLSWASAEILLEYYSDASLRALVDNRGVAINHHYYPFVCYRGQPYGFYQLDPDGRLRATEIFNGVLRRMRQLQDERKLYLSTIGEMMDYWLALEDLSVNFVPPDTIVVRNGGRQSVRGCSFAVPREIKSSDIPFQSRRIDGGDRLVWFDLEGSASASFRLVPAPETSAESTPASLPATPNTPGRSGMYEVDWLLNAEKGFVAFFRPRCGSTTVTRWFFEALGHKFGGFSIAAFRNEWLEPRFEELSAVLQARYDELHKFAIIRDPFERAVSSYLHAVDNPNDYQWDVIKPFMPAGMQKHDLTFRQFVEFLHKDDLDTATIIWRRQSVMSCWKRGVDDVVLLPELNEYLERMNAKYGFTVKPGFNSVTVAEGEKVQDCDRSYADVPFCELLALKEKGRFRSFPDYRCFYDARLRKDIRELYRDDICIYHNVLRSRMGPLRRVAWKVRACLDRFLD